MRGNAVDADRYRVHSAVCVQAADPRRWTRHVNDQCVAVGWAGYDAKVAWLPPEHFLAHRLREGRALTCAFAHGRCRAGAGRQAGGAAARERRGVGAGARVADAAAARGGETCSRGSRRPPCWATPVLQREDRRWHADWREVELLHESERTAVEGGSEGDNGQTGRKLAVDYYGPSVPIGGGALSGKDLSHIDRAAA